MNENKPSSPPSQAATPKPHNPHPRPRNWIDRRQSNEPVLRFTPYAWAKLLWFRDHGDTEIGGFGICPANDLLLVEDIVTVKQLATSVSVEFDDEAVADLFDKQVDAGRRPEQFARLWMHSHPGDCAHPSATDEETFDRVFGDCDWALMFIVAKGGETYARLRHNVGPSSDRLIAVEVDHSTSFPAGDDAARLEWEMEYRAHVVSPREAHWLDRGDAGVKLDDPALLDQFAIDDDVFDRLDEMAPANLYSASGIGA